MPLDWNALLLGKAPPDGAEVIVEGGAFPSAAVPGTLLLAPEAPCCLGCRPEPDSTIEVLLASPAPRGPGPFRLAGRWHNAPQNGPGWRWQLREARILAAPGPWLSRRGLLAAAPLLCAAACTPPGAATGVEEGAGRTLLASTAAMDLHSHAGRVTLARVPQRAPGDLAAPMREGGIALVSLAMVADTPVTHVTPDRRIEAARAPAPGELWAHGEAAFARLHALVAAEKLALVTDAASLARARQPGAGPSVVVAAEGADFLEGRIERLERVFREQRLRHLQLVHYRVNELGDIQTAAPEHDGLTLFGEEVVRACNRLGILVDVAHGTLPLVERAARVSDRPIILSHTAISRRPGPRSRMVTPAHAKVVGETGGMVGVWPLVGSSPTPRLYAESIARMVEAVGIDHVGIGSDMRGLLSPGALEDYRATPALAEALLATGFSAAEATKLLGENFARVLAATLPA
ncbi:peptidase M19 [Roseomonas sp. KE2513]|uniref:dipeptidase n=1 Tax=Roseomonas sp. KE2513 TaxID=2479202 RepID=UPI0018DEF5AA|nr:membrane dipeptidase [Roseomonas sp. KE2513]MBI0535439.1 peptidase M19 [Roseomonas sp. KE2513]